MKLTEIDKNKNYYLLNNEIVEQIEQVEHEEDGYITFKGVTFPKASWTVPKSRAELIEEEITARVFIRKEIELNEYIDRAEVYVDNRICAVLPFFRSEDNIINGTLSYKKVKSLETVVKDGTLLYYFKSE